MELIAWIIFMTTLQRLLNLMKILFLRKERMVLESTRPIIFTICFKNRFSSSNLLPQRDPNSILPSRSLQNNRLKKFTQVDDETRDEFDLLQEQLSRTSTELRGKKFAVDATGKAIGIAPIKSEALPPYSLFPSHNISSSAVTSNEKGTGAGAGTATGVGGKKGTRKRVSKDQTLTTSASTSPSYPHFLPTPSLATSLSAHSSIPLAPGVSLKSKVILENTNNAAATASGAQPASAQKVTSSPIVREGPNLPPDPKKLSRSEYFAKQQTISRMTSIASSTGAPGTGTGYEGGSIDRALDSFASTFGEMSEYSSTSSPAGAPVPRSSSRGMTSGGGVKTNRYLDLNPGREIDHEQMKKAKELKAREEQEREDERLKESLSWD